MPLAELTVAIAIRMGSVVLFAPAFMLPALFIAAFGAFLGQVYVSVQLSVKREMTTAKAPVLGVLSGAIAGLRMFLSLYHRHQTY